MGWIEDWIEIEWAILSRKCDAYLQLLWIEMMEQKLLHVANIKFLRTNFVVTIIEFSCDILPETHINLIF